MSDALELRRVLIAGRVQGVFFRASMKKKADSLGVLGWVRNCGDGSVEAKFASTCHQALADMISWCHEGPEKSQVLSVTIFETEPDDQMTKQFSIIRDTL